MIRRKKTNLIKDPFITHGSGQNLSSKLSFITKIGEPFNYGLPFIGNDNLNLIPPTFLGKNKLVVISEISNEVFLKIRKENNKIINKMLFMHQIVHVTLIIILKNPYFELNL